MTAEQFEQTLFSLIRRKPFLPFTVVYQTGERFEVDQAEAVAASGGAGGFIGPTGEIHFFDHENVSEFITTPAGMTS